MKRIAFPTLVVVLLLLLAGLAVWWFSPTEVVKRRVASFFSTAEVPATMSDIGRGARGTKVATYLAQSVTLNSPESVADEVGSTFSRDRASVMYAGVARFCREITFTDLEFTRVEITADAATVSFRIDTLVELPGRRPVDGIVVADSLWRKIDGDWLLESMRWTEEPR